jgi:hypothetical protein
MKKLILPALLCMVSFAPVIAQQKVAQPPPSGSKAVLSSHRGSYSRLHLGVGYFVLSLPVEGNLASNPGFSFGGHIGTGVSNHLVGFASLDYEAAPNYTIIQSLVTYKGVLISVNIGIGFIYYFLPGDVFISAIGNLCATQYLSEEGSEITTEPGPGGILSVGKDWHVSNRLRFGVAYTLNYSSLKLKDSEVLENMFSSLESDKLNTLIHGFTFSLTFGPRHQQQIVN